jgi:hypothetical protein
MFAFIFITTIYLRWDLKRKFWFWIMLCRLTAAHLPLRFLVRWTDESHGVYGDIPSAPADFAIVYEPIRLLEIALTRRFQRS